MTSAQQLVDDFAARLNKATNVVAQDIKNAQDAVLAAVSRADAGTQTAVADALGQLQAPLQVLERLGVDNSDPVPGTSPTPSPIPAPSEAQDETPGPVDESATPAKASKSSK